MKIDIIYTFNRIKAIVYKAFENDSINNPIFLFLKENSDGSQYLKRISENDFEELDKEIKHSPVQDEYTPSKDSENYHKLIYKLGYFLIRNLHLEIEPLIEEDIKK